MAVLPECVYDFTEYKWEVFNYLNEDHAWEDKSKGDESERAKQIHEVAHERESCCHQRVSCEERGSDAEETFDVFS